MADSGPSRHHGWILRVRVIPGNGLDSFGDLLGTDLRNVALRNRGPETQISSNALRSKIKKIFRKPMPDVPGKVGGRSPPTLRGRGTPNMPRHGPKLTIINPDSQPNTCISYSTGRM